MKITRSNSPANNPVNSPLTPRQIKGMQALTAQSEPAMIELGQQMSRQFRLGEIVFLEGDLGAGKTTLVRGILKEMGHIGLVVSPTYTLVEPYEFSFGQVYHFDLYRLNDAAELEMIGVREMINPHSLCLFEWPERGVGILPNPHWQIKIAYVSSESPDESHRRVEVRRCV